MKNSKRIQLGLEQNIGQFSLLVLINAFVGGMIGIERSIFSEFATIEFAIDSTTAILSFIAAFGLAKALANYYAGRWANQTGRKNLLVIGWLIAVPVPWLLIYAESWAVVVGANLLLGLSQGLTWSSTIVMKIDLVGPKSRGLAMGLNEFAGYLAVGLFAILSNKIAEDYGIRPYPFYLGVIISLLGLALSFFFVKDTCAFVQLEDQRDDSSAVLAHPFWDTTLRHKKLSSITYAGLINNLNDGMIWGLLPLLLLSLKFESASIGMIVGIYPLVWGIGQLFTGNMGDQFNKSKLIFWGMFIQGLAIIIMPITTSVAIFLIVSVALGLGTALVYPNFLSGIAEIAPIKQRAEVIGIFRLWRDLGYVFGALLSGVIADYMGLNWAIFMVGLLTFSAALIIRFRYNS
jgi:MFS family permease